MRCDAPLELIPNAEDGSKPKPKIPLQTPLYHALNKSRYARQELIKTIQELTGRKLLVYFANPFSSHAFIDAMDIAPFGDLLHRISQDSEIDLLLQSPGGDIDKAEKIVYMCRSRCTSFRVIVPESAKSAATMIALAADEIVMGYTSELGPIDPQIITLVEGKLVQRPAKSFLDGLEQIKKEVEKNQGQLSPVYFPLLTHLDPSLIDYCVKAIERTKAFAKKWLMKGMCKGDVESASRIAEELTDNQKYLSHGSVIDWQEAIRIGLKITYLPPEEELWEILWRLYCIYLADLQTGPEGQVFSKVFESEHVSIII